MCLRLLFCLSLLCLLACSPSKPAPEPEPEPEINHFSLTLSTFTDGSEPRKNLAAWWYSGPQKAGTEARLDTPSGLGLGQLTFNIGPQLGTRDNPMNLYWGSAESLPPDQPKKVRRSEAIFLMSSSWRGSTDPIQPKVTAEAKGAGKYSFSLSNSQSVSFELGEAQEYLPPIELVTPESFAVQVGEQAVKLEWKPVEGAVAYGVRAMGDDSHGEKAIWYCPQPWSESLNLDGPEGALAKGVLLGPDQTECTLPAAIFRGSSISIHAFSPSVAGSESTIGGRAWAESTAYVEAK